MLWHQSISGFVPSESRFLVLLSHSCRCCSLRVMQSDTTHFVVGKHRSHSQSIHTALIDLFPREIIQLSIIEEIDEIIFGRCGGLGEIVY